MCDYCGCRDTPAIEELSNEHERVLELVYTLRQQADLGDREGALAVLEDLMPLLAVHTEKEEAGLFAQLRRRWEADARLDALVAEHRDIELALSAVHAGDAGWPATVRRTARILTDHVLAEETDLFPYAMYELGDREWAAIDAVHRALDGARARVPAR